MVLTKTAIKRIFKNPISDNLHTISDEYCSVTCLPPDWMDVEHERDLCKSVPETSLIYKVKYTGIIITDARHNKHRVFSTFTKNGLEHVIIKDRHFELVKGKETCLTKIWENTGECYLGDITVTIRANIIDLDTVISNLTKNIFSDTTAPVFFNY